MKRLKRRETKTKPLPSDWRNDSHSLKRPGGALSAFIANQLITGGLKRTVLFKPPADHG